MDGVAQPSITRRATHADYREKGAGGLGGCLQRFLVLMFAGASPAAAQDAESTDKNQAACLNWCEKISPCKCTTVKGCGKGGEIIRNFRGKGQKWYACRFESDIQAWNKTNCEGYCARNKSKCSVCKDKEGCGPGNVKVKTFRFGNRTNLNYYACQKK